MNLVIVESPAKAKTIEKFLGKGYLVKSCNGHIRDLSKKDLSINIEHNYTPIYEILPEKKALLAELKKFTEKSEKIYLATDEDREGEAISWHLTEALQLDASRTERITFHEITRDAILRALQEPRKIDYNLVNAQQARRILDRLVGYELSPLLWKKVKAGLSAGRVQSVAVKLIVEREREILAFQSESNYQTIAIFQTQENDKEFRAELSHRFASKDEVIAFLEKCKNAQFQVLHIEKKPSYKSPPPPFITSTLQQEASRKLGFSVAKTMQIAQNLYETGKITYMRTDSVNLSDMAIAAARKEIEKMFGAKYAQPRQYKTKVIRAQEAHEAIRPTYMNVHQIDGTKDEQKLYELIWKRTIASQMANAQLEKTTVEISSPEPSFKFIAQGEIILFDGFLKVYIESADDAEEQEENVILPPLNVHDILIFKQIQSIQKFTNPPYRYSEASLVRKLEELGIGRPSTYAPIISTIQKRGYVVLKSIKGSERQYEVFTLKENKIINILKKEYAGGEKNKLFPTDLGIIVTDFLSKKFPDIMDYHFTAHIEKEFDEIAAGQLEWTKMIDAFYKKFHPQVETISKEKEKIHGERLLGKDPKTGENVYVKMGRYGPIVQIGDSDSSQKPRFASLLKHQSIHSITLEEALKLFDFPLYLGKHEQHDIYIHTGPYGIYLKWSNKNYAIPPGTDPFQLTLDDAVKIILAKDQKNEETIIKDFGAETDISIRQGKWGPYIKHQNKNYKIPKDFDPATLTLEECVQIIQQATQQQSASNHKKTRSSSRKK